MPGLGSNLFAGDLAGCRSMQKSLLLSGVCAGALALSAGAAAQQAATDQPSAASPNVTTLAEVIVTAEKREQRLIDVPASVSAVTGETLSQQGMTSVTDFAALVPGLTFSGAGEGSTTLVLRGINTGSALGPSVGVLVDGVPIGASTSSSGGGVWSPDAGTWDLNRIEVLKGPQSTLYGASGMTGLLSYVYNQPSLQRFEAAGESDLSGTGDGGGFNYAVRGMVNIPLIEDQLALRVAASHEDNSGYVQDPTLNKSQINTYRQDTVRAAVLWQATPALTVKLEGNYQQFNRGASDDVLYDRTTGKPVNGSLQEAQGLVDPESFTLHEVALTLGYDLGPATLTSVTSYQAYDGTINAFFTNSALGASLKGVGAVNTGVLLQPVTDKWTQELRLVSKDQGPLHYIAGIFYTSENSLPEQTILGYAADGSLLPGLNPLLTIHEPDTYREYAGYAQAGYTFFDRLDITGGFRFTHDTTSYYDVNGGLLAALIPNVPNTSASEDEENYLVTAKYKLTQTSNIYGRLSSGYRPGGPNSGVPGAPLTFNPDHLWNYEVGYKADLWDGRAEIDADAFYVTWSDIQVSATTPQGFSYTANGKKATSQGIEAHASVVPVQGLSLSGSVDYTNAHLVDAVPQLGGAAGERLPNSPVWSGAILADYHFPLSGNLYGFVGGTLRAVGARNTAFDGDPSTPQFNMPGYVLGDLRAGVDEGRWTLTAYVHNVGDSRAELSGGAGGDAATDFAHVEIARPRTIGVMVDARY
jgi:iron complex outermembrane receptor protein